MRPKQIASFIKSVKGALSESWEPYCWAPWTHAYVAPSGNRALCCLSNDLPANKVPLGKYWNSHVMRKLRRKMRRNLPPAECSACISSANPAYAAFNDISEESKNELRKNTTFGGTLRLPPTSFDYRPSNLCNFKCRMCGPDFSSSHEKETLELNGPYSLFKWQRDPEKELLSAYMTGAQEELLESIERGSIRKIYWAGGEPLLIDFHWLAMRRIVDLGLADQVQVYYNTNLSLLKFKGAHLYHDLLRHFPNFQIGASLDATGVVGEYIRNGMHWPLWERNFSELRSCLSEEGQKISIALCLTTPGLLDLPNLLRFAQKHNVDITAQLIYVGGGAPPAMTPLSPLALPKRLLVQLVNEVIAEIEPMRGPGNETLFRELENLRLAPVWSEAYPESYARGLRAEIQKLKNTETHQDPQKLKPGFQDLLSQWQIFQPWLEEYW